MLEKKQSTQYTCNDGLSRLWNRLVIMDVSTVGVEFTTVLSKRNHQKKWKMDTKLRSVENWMTKWSKNWWKISRTRKMKVKSHLPPRRKMKKRKKNWTWFTPGAQLAQPSTPALRNSTGDGATHSVNHSSTVPPLR